MDFVRYFYPHTHIYDEIMTGLIFVIFKNTRKWFNFFLFFFRFSLQKWPISRSFQNLFFFKSSGSADNNFLAILQNPLISGHFQIAGEDDIPSILVHTRLIFWILLIFFKILNFKWILNPYQWDNLPIRIKRDISSKLLQMQMGLVWFWIVFQLQKIWPFSTGVLG